MSNFWFYIELGLNHVLDFSAYDHILFLTALSLPFTFKSWKKVLVLATVFTIAHCTSLGLSVYEVVVMDSGLIEFLIPVTILSTAIFNLVYLKSKAKEKSILLHILATGFFGLIHGFGFSNYFKMLMAGEEEKLSPLLGFAAGIELSQVLIVMAVLALAYIIQSFFKVKQVFFVTGASILVILITIPMLVATFPW
ncbi:HupE/UreJ family protein [Maribacter polysiphoniae]|uniref:HupE/UreJ family protein n=1 Tax=Maribacter polysiphoniae TaxID=429344 RepID=A0A316EQJ9_9FLAO|nr:HupE/UreJ family protein [Maribacter polysiphoniae]MBD1259886.1 HupE/UreJ family protein [Maribacter polysiphoniae]PWK25340.1 HupE/UreJ protein [Maribacter polysiphoniae]